MASQHKDHNLSFYRKISLFLHQHQIYGGQDILETCRVYERLCLLFLLNLVDWQPEKSKSGFLLQIYHVDTSKSLARLLHIFSFWGLCGWRSSLVKPVAFFPAVYI